MRYLLAYVDPVTGRERLGTGPDCQVICNYASPKNVARYLLPGKQFPAGQYALYSAPGGAFAEKFVTHLYKRT